MRKNGLLVGALALGALVSLSSCENSLEIEFKTFEEAYSQYKDFFAKTFENAHMEILIEKEWDSDYEKRLRSRETVLGTSSYFTDETDSDAFSNNWAFINADGVKIAAKEERRINPDHTVTSVGKTYCVGNSNYSNTYKSYIKGLNYLEVISQESLLTGKSPEELGRFDVVSGKRTRGLDQNGSSFLGVYLKNTHEDSPHFVYYMQANMDNKTGLVTSVDVHFCDEYIYKPSLPSPERGDFCMRFTMRYDDAGEITPPDISDWEFVDKQ